jgi:hypothetical protein
MDPGIADVSDTALWIAAYRARELSSGQGAGCAVDVDSSGWVRRLGGESRDTKRGFRSIGANAG